MGYRRLCYRYSSQNALLAPEAAVGLAFFVLVPLPLMLLFIAGAVNSAPCATLSDKSGTICLERLN